MQGRHRIRPLLHLLDASVLIDAKNYYYPLDRVPEFWDWLVHMGLEGRVKIPMEIYDEIIEGNDELVDWLKENKAALVFEQHVNRGLVCCSNGARLCG